MRTASCLQRTGCRLGTQATPPARSCLQTRPPRATLLALCGPRSACNSRRYSTSWRTLAVNCMHTVGVSACSNVAKVQFKCCLTFSLCITGHARQRAAVRNARGEICAQRDDQERPRAGPCGQLLGQRGQQQPQRCCARGPPVACTASCGTLGLGPGPSGCAQRPASLHRRCRCELLAGGRFRNNRTCPLHSGPSSPRRAKQCRTSPSIAPGQVTGSAPHGSSPEGPHTHSESSSQQLLAARSRENLQHQLRACRGAACSQRTAGGRALSIATSSCSNRARQTAQDSEPLAHRRPRHRCASQTSAQYDWTLSTMLHLQSHR